MICMFFSWFFFISMCTVYCKKILWSTILRIVSGTKLEIDGTFEKNKNLILRIIIISNQTNKLG